MEERLIEPELHYEFVPGLAERGFGWHWMLDLTDDAGTEYSDSNGGALPALHGGLSRQAAPD